MNPRDKKFIFSLIIIILILFLAGGYYFLASKKSSQNQEPSSSQQEQVISLKPEDLGLEFTFRGDKKAVKFVINNIKDIVSLEYTINYKRKMTGKEAAAAESEGGEVKDVEEGMFGEAKPRLNDTKIEIGYRELGTCSSGVCKYHEVTSSLKLVLKIIKKDNKIYSSEKTLEIGPT